MFYLFLGSFFGFLFREGVRRWARDVVVKERCSSFVSEIERFVSCLVSLVVMASLCYGFRRGGVRIGEEEDAGG